MRIERMDAPLGRIYKIYRSGPDFIELMRRLVPLLLQSGCEVLIGGTDDDPDVVITFGPADSDTAARFERKVESLRPP